MPMFNAVEPEFLQLVPLVVEQSLASLNSSNFEINQLLSL